jgi:DNA-binding CsgD family transcriptional regulator
MRQHVAFVFVSLSALVCIVSLLRTTARREESNVADSERPPLRIKPLLPLTLFCLVAGVLCEAMFRIDMASDALPFPFYLFICINFLVAHGIAVVRIAGWPRLILHTVCPAAALLLAVVLGSVLRLLGLHAILAATADVTLLTTTYFCIIVFAKSRAYSVVLSVCFANSGMHLGVAACSMAMPSIAEALKVLEVQAGILYAISTMFMLLLFVVFHSFTQRSLGRERFQAALATLRAEQEPDDGRQEFDAYFIWHLMGEGLTEHQAKIANYIATGHSHLQVAERFVISQHTVRNHSVNICDKLLLHGAKDLMDLYHATTGFSYFVSGSNTVSLDTMPFEPRSRNKKTKAKKKA